MKVAILWTQLSGYLNACMKELAVRDNIDLFVCHEAPGKDAPFDEGQFAWITKRFMWRTQLDLYSLEQQLRAFAPDILVVAGWHIPAYRRLAKKLQSKCWRVMTMDNPWAATVRQRVGTWIAPYYLRSIADVAWVPGERQAVFARKLGFQQGAILRGLYACDQAAFEAMHLQRLAEGRPVPRFFLFAGRFSPQKGLDTLVRAYQAYRETDPDPWPLICCGAGPLRSHLEAKPGIRIEGFVQPAHMPPLFAAAGCLVVPSVFEPWALVIHEAVSAGLLALASEKAGAAVHLVQPGYNGFIFDSQDAAGLASLMSQISAMSDSQLDAMSRASHSLSLQFSPQRWADTLLDAFHVLRHEPTARQGAVIGLKS